MKLYKICALLTALLLTGCAALPTADPAAPLQTEAPETAETAAAETTEAAPVGTATPATESVYGEWEEEWPEEYPVTQYRLADGAITQTGELQQYRYVQLPAAEDYVGLLAVAARSALGDPSLEFTMDSPHDGYANWFIDGENGSAAVSGSSITGRFCYSVYPGFDRVLAQTEAVISEPDALRQIAEDFAAQFSSITGDLVLVSADPDEMYYHDERTTELRDVTVPVMVYTFRPAEQGRVLLDIQPGNSVPVTCGDSTIPDLSVHCFTVTVWPDGTVIAADNYITLAEIAADGTVRMIDESDMQTLLSYLTSTTENDCVVIESIRADRFSVYFGDAGIEPTLWITYYFESDPSDVHSTEFVLPGLF